MNGIPMPFLVTEEMIVLLLFAGYAAQRNNLSSIWNRTAGYPAPDVSG